MRADPTLLSKGGRACQRRISISTIQAKATPEITVRIAPAPNRTQSARNKRIRQCCNRAGRTRGELWRFHDGGDVHRQEPSSAAAHQLDCRQGLTQPFRNVGALATRSSALSAAVRTVMRVH